MRYPYLIGFDEVQQHKDMYLLKGFILFSKVISEYINFYHNTQTLCSMTKKFKFPFQRQTKSNKSEPTSSDKLYTIGAYLEAETDTSPLCQSTAQRETF